MPAARKPADDTETPDETPEPKRSGREAYVAVDAISWRPHPLPRGTEVSEILPADVLEACLADGRVTREPPE
jgi:hypothetical protein